MKAKTEIRGVRVGIGVTSWEGKDVHVTDEQVNALLSLPFASEVESPDVCSPLIVVFECEGSEISQSWMQDRQDSVTRLAESWKRGAYGGMTTTPKH